MLTRRRPWVPALVAVAALVGCGSGTAPTPHGQLIASADREAAPSFDGQLIDGDQFSSDALADRVVVLNFWGSWCGPCRVEVPDLQELHAEADDAVAVVGVNIRDERQMARAFLDDGGVTYPSLFDPRGEVVTAFADHPITLTPATVLLDDDGRVAAVYVGAVSHEDLDGAVDDLLAESS